MQIQKINTINTHTFTFKGKSKIDNNKKYIDPIKINNITLGVFAVTSVIAGCITTAKKIKHPIYNALETGAGIAFLAMMGMHLYNTKQQFSKNNKK